MSGPTPHHATAWNVTVGFALLLSGVAAAIPFPLQAAPDPAAPAPAAAAGAVADSAVADTTTAVADSVAVAKADSATVTAELPPDVATAFDFPGAIRIPKSDAAIKIGGRLRMAIVATPSALGSDDRFLTNSIPVGDTTTVAEAARTSFSARASRLNFEFRAPAGKTQLRTFFEGDFASPSNGFRLRHAYAQVSTFIFGQTWSTFSDPDRKNIDLDFEGISAENNTRQAQVRYWWRPVAAVRAAFAMEQPTVSVTGGTGVSVIPDLVARAQWEYHADGHLQAAVVSRGLRATPDVDPTRVEGAHGYGISLSGSAPLTLFRTQNRFEFQFTGGRGVARYINDLSSQPGQDAAFDSTGTELFPFDQWGFYGSLEHRLNYLGSFSRLDPRITLLWSRVKVQNLDFQPPDAYQLTDRVSVNALVVPHARVQLGFQFIHGMRRNKDLQQGFANQLQAVALVYF